MPDVQPRQLTEDEVRDEFLATVAALVNEWANYPDKSPFERCEGTAFSILAALDGCGGGLPGFVVAPAPHPADRAYHVEQGENYYPEAPPAECDISGGLHELLKTHTARYRHA